MDPRIIAVTEANRAGWNRIAHRRSGLPVERFRDGAVCPEAPDLSAFAASSPPGCAPAAPS